MNGLKNQHEGYKWKVGWGVTSKCNMYCPFCYSVVARSDSIDLDLDILKAFVERNHNFIESINYGTGENTLSDDWFELVKYVQADYPHIEQALTTNGYLAPALEKRQDAETILSALDEVDLSLDYNDQERHSAFRGNSHAFQWAMETMALCRDANIETTLVVLGLDDTLQRDNLEQIFGVAEEFGCYVRVNIFRPNHQQKLPPLSYQVLKDALAYIFENHVVVSLSDPLFSALVQGKEVPDASGTTSLRILPDGSITPSTYLVTSQWKRAHIKDARLDSHEFIKNLADGISTEVIPGECSSCSISELCKGGAIDRRQIWYERMDRRDPYCPMKNGDVIKSWRKHNTIRTVKGPGIHDGYLPTLIFAPISFAKSESSTPA